MLKQMLTQKIFTRTALSLLLACAAWFSPTAQLASAVTEADTVVGNGYPCTGQGVANAIFFVQLSGGGNVTFNCGTATITLPYEINIQTQITIDGGNQITLRAAQRQIISVEVRDKRHFTVSPSAGLTLKNITLADGGPTSGDGGAVFVTQSSLTVDKVTFSNNYPLNGSGGAISGDANAIININNTILVDNRAAWNGGAINALGVLRISNSNMLSNTAEYYGGAIFSANDAVLNNVSVVLNTALASISGQCTGGGIYSQASLTINASSIEYNHALQGSGGGICNFQSLTLDSVQLSHNDAQYNGGGLYNSAPASISNSQLYDNRAKEDGGGIYSSAQLDINDSLVISNTAIRGGGLLNSANANVSRSEFAINNATNNVEDGLGAGIMNFGELTVDRTAFVANAAHWEGGAIYNRYGLTVTNSTFNGNTASNGGAALQNMGNARLTFATLIENGTFGGALRQNNGLASSSITLSNTVLVHSALPYTQNCGAVSGGRIVSVGNNLTDDNSCDSFFTQASDLKNVDAKLTASGVDTSTVPALGSPLIDAGHCISGITTDQRGSARQQGPRCDIGAVEAPYVPPPPDTPTPTPTATATSGPSPTPTATARPGSTVTSVPTRLTVTFTPSSTAGPLNKFVFLPLLMR